MRTSQPGPPGQANMAPWQRWLLPGIIVAFFVALFALPRGAVAGARFPRAAVVHEQDIARRAQRRFLAKIDEAFAPVVHANQHEPAAPDVAATRIHDGQRVADGNGRIDSIAAALEHLAPRLRR